jgi:hypothetical protein
MAQEKVIFAGSAAVRAIRLQLALKILAVPYILQLACLIPSDEDPSG